MAGVSRPTRYSSLSLKDVVCLCAERCDDAAWEEFVLRVGKPISLTIVRTASLWGEPSRSRVEDLLSTDHDTRERKMRGKVREDDGDADDERMMHKRAVKEAVSVYD